MNKELIKRLKALEPKGKGLHVSFVETMGRTDDEIAAEVERIEAEDSTNGKEPLIIIMDLKPIDGEVARH